MVKEKLSTSGLFTSIEQTFFELLKLISSAGTKTINMVPFKDSWTAAQVASHITKSNNAIARSLHMAGKGAERDPRERTGEIKEMFLNYSTKFQSPEFILPTRDIYQKEMLIDDLKQSINKLKKTGNIVSLSEIINLPAFGEITKYELLHFVLYHTQRHIHQLKKIFECIEEKE